ncbi:hypothetical protein TSUD_239290 [Trifolium subterraneum]|uniref:Uncharacterized protein n=1 Tax=Trifolium subterraneum TaxID=3900 RepID=A0A2Z6NFW1_TRISU|nr:hypothetical protein TSUD_239290 [Trifolium subterraneum]
MGRQQGGESKWLRHGGDPNWVAPNPVIMHNQCMNENFGNSESTTDKGVNDHNVRNKKELQIADIFRKPEILFPKWMEANYEANDHNQTMEEDDLEALIVEGNRKRSRVMAGTSHVPHNKNVPDQQNNMDNITISREYLDLRMPGWKNKT